MHIPWLWTWVSGVGGDKTRRIRKRALKHTGCKNVSLFEEAYCHTTGEPTGVKCRICGKNIQYKDKIA